MVPGAMTDISTKPENLAVLARWRRALAVYFDRRVLIVLVLGFSAGLPLALTTSTLLAWMTEAGVSLTAIGLYSLVGLPYTLKFLWAPVVDAVRLPMLTRRLGRRRSWLVFAQLLLMAAVGFLGVLDPVLSPWTVALAALLIAFASATQDIVIDAFRVESLERDQQAAGVAGYVAAYRIALLVSGAGTLLLVDWLQDRGSPGNAAWGQGYFAMAALFGVGIAAALAAREPALDAEAEARIAAQPREHPALRLLRASIEAFADFFRKPHVAAILLFVLLFKFCDAFAGVMTTPFVLKLGFDKTTYAAIVKGAGLAAVLAGGFLGGFLARALPMVEALWLAAVLQMASNLAFAWLAWVGLDARALAATIVIENFTGGIGTVLFVGYLSALCTSALHTATQFALLTALSAVGRTVLASASGFIVEATGWITFFLITTASAVPALALLAWLQRNGHFAALDRPAGTAAEP